MSSLIGFDTATLINTRAFLEICNPSMALEHVMRLQELLKAKREDILRLAAEHGARHICIFGSVARGDDDDQSDIDFLVEMEPGRSLLDMGGLLMDLQELLGCQVDVVSVQGLKARIRDHVLKEAIPL